MKVPLPFTCPACNKQFALNVRGSALPEYANCPSCGATTYLMEPLGNIVAMLLMERAQKELAHDDFTISTLLSAIAVESEMAFLFFKWKGIDSGKVLGNQTQEDRKQWEHEWANMRSVGKRLDELCRFLTSRSFDEFARMKMNLLKNAVADYDPAASIKDFLQKEFFDKRNDIAHYGNIDLGQQDGTRSMSLATAFLNFCTRWTRRAMI